MMRMIYLQPLESKDRCIICQLHYYRNFPSNTSKYCTAACVFSILCKGSYNPFLRPYRYAQDKYTPLLKGIDATGTQKGVYELAF
jgi:hypothetical protein